MVIFDHKNEIFIGRVFWGDNRILKFFGLWEQNYGLKVFWAEDSTLEVSLLTCIWVFVFDNGFTNLFPLFFMFFQLFLSIFFSSLIGRVHIFPTFGGRSFPIAPHFDESI